MRSLPLSRVITLAALLLSRASLAMGEMPERLPPVPCTAASRTAETVCVGRHYAGVCFKGQVKPKLVAPLVCVHGRLFPPEILDENDPEEPELATLEKQFVQWLADADRDRDEL
jgi:hypothetical protein